MLIMVVRIALTVLYLWPCDRFHALSLYIFYLLSQSGLSAPEITCWLRWIADIKLRLI
jgi:hypothetical protein